MERHGRRASPWVRKGEPVTLILMCLIVLSGCRSDPNTSVSQSPIEATERAPHSLPVSNRIGNLVSQLKTTQRPPSESRVSVHLPEDATSLVSGLGVDEPTLRQSSSGRVFGWRMDLEGSSELGWRWRNRRVELLQDDLKLARPQQLTTLRRLAEPLLADRDMNVRVASAHTLIALAREGDQDAMDRMQHIVVDEQLPTAIRCAAMETDALANGERTISRLREYALADTLGTPKKRPPPSTAALAAEAIRNLVVYRSVDEEPLFGAVLSNSAKPVQLAALEAWESPTATRIPPNEVLVLLEQSEQRIRETALRVLAIRPIPGSYPRISKMMLDPHYRVQQAAARAMISADATLALEDLQSVVKGGSELVRSSIATAFAHHGFFDRVYEMADDPSWRVREAVATATASDERPIAERVVSEMIVDRSAQVQEAAINAISSWPVERAGPLLLNAMKSNVFVIRDNAKSVLAQKWELQPETFLPGATRSDRAKVIRRLEQSFAYFFGTPTRLEHVRLVAVDLDSSIEQLQKAEPSKRAAALAKVVASIEQREMNTRQAKKIIKTVGDWRTPAVWPLLIAAMGADDVGRFLILQPVLNGDHSPSWQAACDHLAEYPLVDDRKTAAFVVQHLQRLTRGSDHRTAGKALLALASTGDREHVPWVATFLSVGDRRLRISAALALVQFDDERGTHALERLARERNAQVRRALLDSIRQLKDPQLAYILVRMLDDRVDVGRLALQALNAWVEDGVLPAGSYPRSISTTASFAEQKVAWQSVARSLAPSQPHEVDLNHVQPASFESFRP